MSRNMSTGPGPSYKLSPNEEAALLKEERDRRRKLRLKQVREQDRLFSRRLLEKARARKETELQALSAKLEAEWQAVQTEKREALGEVYAQCLESVGNADRGARNQKPLDEERALAAQKNKQAAEQRHQAARQRESTERAGKWQKENAHIIARKNALEVERVRASHVAKLPPPKRNPLADLDLQRAPVLVTRSEGFSTTHYHVPADCVERAGPHEQEDARVAAQEEAERLKEQGDRREMELRERAEKASLRHKHAKEKELLKQDYQHLLLELSDLQHADRRRRQAVVANIPRQVFQPPHRRLEDKMEKQHQLEEAFEDMYMKHTDYAGDITLALEPRLPDQDGDLDLTADQSQDQDQEEVTLERPVPGPGLGLGAWSHLGDASLDQPVTGSEAGHAAGTKPVSARAEMLKRLMGRVRGQQEDWKKGRASAPLSQPQVAPQPPRPGDLSVETTPQPVKVIHPSPEHAPLLTDTPPSLVPTAGRGSPLTATPPLSEHPIEVGGAGGGSASGSGRGSSSGGVVSLETGSLSEEEEEEGSTLLHPMERAARLRAQQIQKQKSTQKDIRIIGQEQQKQFERLTQPYSVPWHTIRLSEPAPSSEDSSRPDLPLEEAAVNRELAASDQRQPGLQPTLFHTLHTDEVVEEPGQSDRLTPPIHPLQRDYSQYIGIQQSSEHQAPGVNLGEAGLSEDGQMGFRVSDQEQSSRTLVGGDRSSEVHSADGPEPIPGRDSSDWLQRARAYQQRLLERQKQKQDSLSQAQEKLQERRERLMRNYSDVQLPSYVPYSLPNDDVGGAILGRRLIMTHESELSSDHSQSEEQERGRERFAGLTIDPHNRLDSASRLPTIDDMGSEEGSGSVPMEQRLPFDAVDHAQSPESRFVLMTEEATSEAMTSESEGGNMPLHEAGRTPLNVGQSSRETETDRMADIDAHVEIRRQQLLEEKKVLEERQQAQQLRLLQKQRELAEHIKKQEERYKGRILAAQETQKFPPPLHMPGPSIEHSPSIQQGIVSRGDSSPYAPQSRSATGASLPTGHDLQHGQQRAPLRQMLQGQVFMPEDLLPHLQAPPSPEQEAETDLSSQSSPGLGSLSPTLGGQLMGVLRPQHLLPHLQEGQRTGSLTYSDQGSQEFSPYAPQIQTFSGSNQGQHSGRLRESYGDDHSSVSLDTQQADLGRHNLHGQVLRPAQLLAELRDIQQEVGVAGGFDYSGGQLQQSSDDWQQTTDSYRLDGSDTRDSTLRSLPGSGMSQGQLGSDERSSRDGPRGVYRELLQGHVFRPGDLLPHLQALTESDSYNLEGSLPNEPLSPEANEDQVTSPYVPQTLHRPDVDVGGSGLYQPFTRLSLSEQEYIEAASPDLRDQNLKDSLAIPTYPLPASQVARQRRPPPANFNQMAMLQEDMAPHELSTILEVETSADERTHLRGIPQTSFAAANAAEMPMGATRRTPAGVVGTPEAGAETRPPVDTPNRGHITASHHQSGQGPWSVIQIARPVVIGHEGDEIEATDRRQQPKFMEDFQERDSSVAASTLSEYALDDDSIGTGHYPNISDTLPEVGLGSHVMGGSTLPLQQRKDPVGQDLRWMDILQSSDSAAPSSNDGAERVGTTAGDSQADEFLPMMEEDNSVMKTDETPHAKIKLPGGYSSQIQKHIAAGLNLDSSNSSGSQTNVAVSMFAVQGESSTSSSSKHSTVIGMVGKSASAASTDDDSPLFVPRSHSAQEFNFQQHPQEHGSELDRMVKRPDGRQGAVGGVISGKSSSSSSDLSAAGGQTQLDPLRTPQVQHHTASAGVLRHPDQAEPHGLSQEVGNLLMSLQSGSQPRFTLPMFSDVSLSGFSVSHEGSTVEAQLQAQEMTAHQSIPDPSSHDHSEDLGDNQGSHATFPSLEELHMEKGILEESELTFYTTFDTTADSAVPDQTQDTGGAQGAVGGGMFPEASEFKELTELPLDVSQSSATSLTMSLLSFQQHEMDLLQDSPGTQPGLAPQSGLGATSGPGTNPLRLTQSEAKPASRAVQSESALQDLTASHQPTSLHTTGAMPSLQTVHLVQVTTGVAPSTGGTQSDSQLVSSPHAQPQARAAQPEPQMRDADSAGYISGSLQEAFLQRKQGFIQASATRQTKVKESRSKEAGDQGTRSQQSLSQGATAFTQTIQNWKKSKAKPQTKQTNVKKASSKREHSPLSSGAETSSRLVTAIDRNAEQKEMRERNLRLYSRLEEVKRDKAEKERQETYAANRQKKKEFEQKLLQARRAKKAKTKTKDKNKNK